MRSKLARILLLNMSIASFGFSQENNNMMRKDNYYLSLSGSSLINLTSLNPTIIFGRDFSRLNFNIGLRYVDDFVFDQGGNNLSLHKGINKLGVILISNYSFMNDKKFSLKIGLELNLINKNGVAFSDNLYKDPIRATHIFASFQPGLEIGYRFFKRFRLFSFSGYGLLVNPVYSNYKTEVNVSSIFNFGLGVTYII